MFCDNSSYDTERIAKNCVNSCNGQQQPSRRMPTYYYDIQTQQSQRDPSSYSNNNLTYRQDRIKIQQNLQPINQLSSLQVIQENTKNIKQQNEQIKAINRNRQIAAILSTIIAFSQRIQTIKQKLVGYPAESFSPVQYFNVLDLAEKGFVDVYDIKRFVNNDRITEKDILTLFKKVNGDHSKDNNKLSYFGYLNMIKPYFNEQLARDLLLRDSGRMNKSRRSHRHNYNERIDNDIIEPTQQSVLLLFQQLILLHCICTSEHEQAKQDLMNSYMLNVIQIKQLIGLQNDNLQPQILNHHRSLKHPNSTHRTPLKVLFQFIQNNSQYQIDFKEMRFLLSFLNAHQFSLTNQKYLSLLFIPVNCKAQLIKHFNQSQQQQNIYQSYNYKGAQNYMNTYLTKENLINKGNIQLIKQYLRNGLLQQQYSTSKNDLVQDHMILTASNSNNKANFLEFVHPKSLQRMTVNNNNNLPSYNDDGINNNAVQFNVQRPSPQQQLIKEQQYYQNEHPQMQIINPSNKYLSKGQSKKQLLTGNSPSQRQSSNPSSIPQQNILIRAPRQAAYNSKHQPTYYEQTNNISVVSHTPFLQKFMKQNNTLPTATKNIYPQYQNNILINHHDYSKSKLSQSKLSGSAFEVVDYGYEPSHNNMTQLNNSRKLMKSNNKVIVNSQQVQQQKLIRQTKPDETQRLRKQSLDSRYNLVISQYKNSQLAHPQNTRKQLLNQPNKMDKQQSSSSQYKNHGPKFERSVIKINTIPPVYNPILQQPSNGNYYDSVGLSQSNMVQQSNFMSRFYQGGGNILNEFLKKA